MEESEGENGYRGTTRMINHASPEISSIRAMIARHIDSLWNQQASEGACNG